MYKYLIIVWNGFKMRESHTQWVRLEGIYPKLSIIKYSVFSWVSLNKKSSQTLSGKVNAMMHNCNKLLYECNLFEIHPMQIWSEVFNSSLGIDSTLNGIKFEK